MAGVFLDDLIAQGWLLPLQAELQENLLLLIRAVISSVNDRAENRQSFKSNLRAVETAAPLDFLTSLLINRILSTEY